MKENRWILNYDLKIHKGTLEKELNKSYSHFSAGLLK
jgi:hypothetical protein